MVQYYTLEQAAQLLRTSPDQLKEMAKKNEVRAFQDRGTLRFRAQEIDELARARGLGSDPDLQLGEARADKPPAGAEPGVFQFALDEGEQAPIGREPVEAGSGSKGSGRKGPKSPPPKSSDSDVRLVSDSADLDFKIAPDSDPKVAKEGPKSGPRSGAGPVAQPDSGVRIVPLGNASDSDVKIVSDSVPEVTIQSGSPTKRPSDSDIRLEGHTLPPAAGGLHKPGSDEGLVTEEIDLDAEARKAEATAKPKARSRPKSSPQLPTTSPFEISDPDLGATKPAPPVKPTKSVTDSSSDFELSVGGNKDSSPLTLSDEEVSLGEMRPAGPGDSGINLQDPADSGISLEQGSGDEIEFELSMDAHSTPKPGPIKKEEDSDSEFELSLDVDSSSEEMEAAKPAGADSDSEFELTLDESGDLAPMEDSGAREKDIFETDFEVPALDEESGSEAVALEDSDSVEDSDFDLALSDEDVGAEEESGSQVVALEDEETGENAPTVARPRPRAGAAVAEQELEDDLGEEGEVVGAPAAAAAPPAEWGALPALVLLPCVIVLFLVTLMSFELIQGMWGYHRSARVPGLIVNPLAKMIAGEDSVPKD
jgi:excisionase family DNA binding protein